MNPDWQIFSVFQPPVLVSVKRNAVSDCDGSDSLLDTTQFIIFFKLLRPTTEKDSNITVLFHW
jgi:hypothetical protein